MVFLVHLPKDVWEQARCLDQSQNPFGLLYGVRTRDGDGQHFTIKGIQFLHSEKQREDAIKRLWFHHNTRGMKLLGWFFAGQQDASDSKNIQKEFRQHLSILHGLITASSSSSNPVPAPVPMPSNGSVEVKHEEPQADGVGKMEFDWSQPELEADAEAKKKEQEVAEKKAKEEKESKKKFDAETRKLCDKLAKQIGFVVSRGVSTEVGKYNVPKTEGKVYGVNLKPEDIYEIVASKLLSSSSSSAPSSSDASSSATPPAVENSEAQQRDREGHISVHESVKYDQSEEQAVKEEQDETMQVTLVESSDDDTKPTRGRRSAKQEEQVQERRSSPRQRTKQEQKTYKEPEHMTMDDEFLPEKDQDAEAEESEDDDSMVDLDAEEEDEDSDGKNKNKRKRGGSSSSRGRGKGKGKGGRGGSKSASSERKASQKSSSKEPAKSSKKQKKTGGEEKEEQPIEVDDEVQEVQQQSPEEAEEEAKGAKKGKGGGSKRKAAAGGGSGGNAKNKGGAAGKKGTAEKVHQLKIKTDLVLQVESTQLSEGYQQHLKWEYQSESFERDCALGLTENFKRKFLDVERQTKIADERRQLIQKQKDEIVDPEMVTARRDAMLWCDDEINWMRRRRQALMDKQASSAAKQENSKAEKHE